MEDLIEAVTGGHVTAVKITLTSVLLGLGLYQTMLMAVGYGKLRPPFLNAASAAVTHRAIGDAIVVMVVLVAGFCLAYYGIEDSPRDGTPGPDVRVGIHIAAGAGLVGVLAFKLVVLHLWRRAQPLLPALGISALILMFVTWLSSAGAFLIGAA